MEINSFIGTLLGDAYIQKQGKKSYSFSFQQSKEDYALWKAEFLKAPYSYRTYKRFDKRTNKEYSITNVHFSLDKCFKDKLYNLFYSPKKEVTKDVLSYLNRNAILLWYLDDGSVYYNGNNCHITISTNGFSKDSTDNIIEWFNENCLIRFTLTSQGAIRITSKKGCILFMHLIEDLIPECMSYKKLSYAIDKYESKLSDQTKIYRNGQLNKNKK